MTPHEAALVRLRYLLREAPHMPEACDIVAARDAVIGEYGRIFHPENLHRLTAEDFKSFLRFENNRHWTGINRHQSELLADMERLRSILATLLDEDRPISRRIDEADRLHGLGKAVMTPILLVVYPDRYGVWNGISEGGMRDLLLWPSMPWGATLGRQYERVNGVLNDLADRLGTDLWTLDVLWWAHLDGSEDQPKVPATGTARAPTMATFVCSECFATKGEHLRSHADVCTDCA